MDKKEKSIEKTNIPLLSPRNIRDVALICLILILSWKVLNTDFSFSIQEFAFTELLALVVSFFAISLSIAFYFKATDTSNLFYDNSYKFTKEISEILGRIEAGFGEKLKHIDEGYAGIRDKFDKLPFDAEKAKLEIEEERKEIEKKKNEQEELLESLAQRAKLAETEKKDLFEKMAKTSRELDRAKSDLRRMQRSVIEHEVISNSEDSIRTRALKYLTEQIYEGIPPGLEGNIGTRLIRNVFSNIADDLHPDAINDLKETGLMDDEGDLTRRALLILTTKLKRMS